MKEKIKLEDFQKKFIEEATDLINELEDALLLIENTPDNKPLVEKIFRVMHSLKGGGAMFGFDKISEFTHNLENIYDLVRNNKLKINKVILDITLASVDHLKSLLNKEDANNLDVQENHALLMVKILGIIQPKEQADLKTIEKKTEIPDIEIEVVPDIKTFHVYFLPEKDIFKNGTNPIYLLDELHSLGQCQIYPHLEKIPVIGELDTSLCYVSWDIIIASTSLKTNIQDIFIFVEDECILEINQLSNTNLLFNLQFLAFVEESQTNKERFDVKEITKYTNQLIKIQSNPSEKKTEEQVQKVKKLDFKDNVISSIRVSSEKIDNLMNLVSELVTTQAGLSLLAEKTKMHELVVISENVENLTRQLRDVAFSISLIPLETTLTRFHRLVRDLSFEFGKEILFEVEGAETELDKTLIQNLTEPLMHIIRNSIDHGIESPEERIGKGKPQQGIINFKAFYSGANVHIIIQDDGRGINSKLIKEKAIQKGLANPDINYTEREILNMIFLPGLSTAQVITDISGRGVGMDVVKRKINEVRGEVEVESNVDVGTITTIKLPLTLSIIDGLLVRIEDNHYLIPLSIVDKIYESQHSAVTDTFNNLIVLDGEQIPYYYLREEFGITSEAPSQEQIIVVKYEDTRIGLVVDYVIGEYQAVLKPLGKHYRNNEIISGATILGDGTIALVLDTNKIIKQFSQITKEEI
jgi:two-component system chemotaxis sensor kinase CheA